jgi:asparagine synthase (glutamine-hydrolysing)
MPGIAGFISKDAHAVSRPVVNDMIGTMVHERFYTSGAVSFPTLGLEIGWTVITGSFADCMPVWNETRDVCLIFSGEDHADPWRVERLQRIGHNVSGDNASYLVHLYEEHGLEFFAMLNGVFNGVIADLRKREVTLFNDRYGMGRIYYHENTCGVFFASEAKALLRVLPQTRSFDNTSVGEFLSCGCALQGRTLFSGISLLPGGSVWTFSPGAPTRKSLYLDHAKLEQSPALAPLEYYETLKDTWARVVPRYFRGHDKSALALTGGVDSRAILAWLPMEAGQVPCYTSAGQYRDSWDVKLAIRLATLAQRPHTQIRLDRRFLDSFAELSERTVYLTDGAADVKGSCDLFVQQHARQLAPIRVSGVYGGEILRRLVVFKPIKINDSAFADDFRSAMAKAPHTYQEEIQCHPLSFTAFKQPMWHLYGPLSVDRSQVTLRSPYLDNELLDVVYRAPPQLARDAELSLRLVSDGNPGLNRIATDRGLAYPATPVLTTLHHFYQEFTFRAEYAYDYGMPQWLARIDSSVKWMHLERLFVGRHKFSHFRLWYRDHFGALLRERLLDPRTRAYPFLNPRAVEFIIEGHTSGRCNYTTELHKLLSLEIIQRRLLDQA